MGGNSNPQTVHTTTKQTNAPWQPAQPYLKDLYGIANQAMHQTQGNQFGGDFVAGPNQWQLDANQALFNLAPQLGMGGQELQNLAMQTAQGHFLDPSTNPWIASAVEQSLKPVQEMFQNQLIPGVTDAAVQQGAYGGSRMNLSHAGLMDQFTREAGGLSSQIYAQNYENERMRQLMAPELFNQANALMMMPSAVQAMAGGQQQQWDQGALENAILRHQEELAAPWRGVGELAQILTAGGFGESSGQSTQVGHLAQQSGGIGGAMQGLMGGAGMGAGFGQTVGGLSAGAGIGAFAPWMAPFAMLGGLGGFFG